MDVTIIPQLADNFCYHISFGSASLLVDCSEPDKVFSYLGGRSVSHLLTTHKHLDHSGGNAEMREKLPDLQIVGGIEDKVPACTMPVSNGDTLEVNGIKITCIHTPCHTRGHIIYLLEVATEGDHQIDRDVYQVTKNVKQAIFTGDTIFIGGCGRFFEGQPIEMVHAMEEARKLPDALVFCGHEYSIQNLEFCSKVDPQNLTVLAMLDECKTKRASGWWQGPTSVKQEMTYNVFMRCFDKDIQDIVGHYNSEDCMKSLRDWKNTGSKL